MSEGLHDRAKQLAGGLLNENLAGLLLELVDESDDLQRELGWRDEHIAELRQLFVDAREGRRTAEYKLEIVGRLLQYDGCSCECDHHWEEHDEDCNLCLACRIGIAIKP
jgi:hypothetical protein